VLKGSRYGLQAVRIVVDVQYRCFLRHRVEWTSGSTGSCSSLSYVNVTIATRCDSRRLPRSVGRKLPATPIGQTAEGGSRVP
jgi:hypothetical protein